MIQPNKLKQAESELKEFNLGDFKIPTEIQDAECQSYVCICIKSKDNAQGTGKIHASRLCYANKDKWEQMKAEVAIKRVSGPFGGLFQMVVILHNPTLPDTFGMDWQKARALTLVEQGKDSSLIAQSLNVKVEDIDLFIESTLPKPLSPTQKGKVNAMMKEGKGQDDAGLQAMAKELDIELDRIKHFIASH